MGFRRRTPARRSFNAGGNPAEWRANSILAQLFIISLLSMITITVKYFGTFSALAGKSEEEIKLDNGATIDDLIKNLSRRYRGEFKKRLETDYGYRNVVFARNGVQSDKNTVLEHGDEVVISFPVGGG